MQLTVISHNNYHPLFNYYRYLKLPFILNAPIFLLNITFFNFEHSVYIVVFICQSLTLSFFPPIFTLSSHLIRLILTPVVLWARERVTHCGGTRPWHVADVCAAQRHIHTNIGKGIQRNKNYNYSFIKGCIKKVFVHRELLYIMLAIVLAWENTVRTLADP